MKKHTQQVIVIGGGDTFDSYEDWFDFLENKKEPRFKTLMDTDWKDDLQENLGKQFEVLIPSMPNKQNAKYEEWKIWFEKHIPHFDEEVVLVGHSLGGIFLAKYLAENNYPKDIAGTFLVAAPHDDKEAEYTLGDFTLPEDLLLLSKQAGTLSFYHSDDDPVVPPADLAKYQKQLPEATLRSFTDRGHFSGDFPEIVEDIKKLEK